MSRWEPDKYGGEWQVLATTIDDLIRDRFRLRGSAIRQVDIDGLRDIYSRSDHTLITVALRRTAYDRIGEDHLPVLARLLHATMIQSFPPENPRSAWHVRIACQDRPDVVAEESVPEDAEYSLPDPSTVPIQAGRFRYLGD